MVTLKINGKERDRTFNNMAQAMVFAHQSGECFAAEKVEFTVVGRPVGNPEEPAKEKPKKTTDKTEEPDKEADLDKKE